MHEMSIAQGILDIALDYGQRNNAKKINCVSLLLGEMAGVETDALNFCWETIVKNTIADGSELKLTRVPLMGRCRGCGKELHIEHYNFICSECGAVLEAISGRELQVEYLDMD